MIHLMMNSTPFNLWLYSAEHLVNDHLLLIGNSSPCSNAKMFQLL